MHTELKPFLEGAVEQLRSSAIDGAAREDWAAWRAEIETLRAQYDDRRELNSIQGINPNIFMHQLSAVSKSAGAYLVDVGQHQMWAAQSIEVEADQRWLTSGGTGLDGGSHYLPPSGLRYRSRLARLW